MTVALKTGSPEVSYIINYGGESSPHGEVHFDSGRLVVGFESGRVWRRKGGFGVTEAHFRAAFAYLTQAGFSRYGRFTSARVGRPS